MRRVAELLLEYSCQLSDASAAAIFLLSNAGNCIHARVHALTIGTSLSVRFTSIHGLVWIGRGADQ